MSAESELARIYDAHAQSLFAFLLTFTRDEEDTREVLQEVFVKLARDPAALDAARDPRSFLLRLARNLAVDLMRRRAARARRDDRFATDAVPLFASGAEPDAAALDAELSAAMATLPADQREAVHLRLWEGLTFDQIARLTGAPLNTAASRYRHGVDKLRARLRPIYDEIV